MDDQERRRISVSRRAFLKRAVAIWAGLSSLPFLKAIIDYVLPPVSAAADASHARVSLGTQDMIPPGTAKIFKVGKDPVIVAHSAGGQFSAFSARCTHLGCIVEYQAKPSAHYSCNCHGSQFDATGKNIAGPAPKPLSPYRVIIEGPTLYVAKT